MTRNTQTLAVRASVLAVQAALLTLGQAARADDAVTELTQAPSSITLGVGDVDKSSAKFGEYNGLNRKGANVIGAFDIRGGKPEGALRYQIQGTDLGLDTRGLAGEVGEQGRFRVSFGYDSLVKHRSDSYQTPYLGNGSGALTLPANWATNQHNCAVNANASGGPAATAGSAGCGNYYINQATNNTTTASPTGNALALTPAEIADFQTVPLETKREKYKLGLLYNFGPEWAFDVRAQHETKDGTQAIGLPFVTTNAQVTIANPISYVTDQVSAALSYTTPKLFGEVSWYLSRFRDNINGVLVQDPYFSSTTPAVAATGIVTTPYPDFARLGTMPDNQFQQFNFNGGYKPIDSLDIHLALSTGRGTQNQAYLPRGTAAWETAPIAAGLSQPSSLNGVVNHSSANLSLAYTPVRNLRGAVSFKSDERDNQTASNLYYYRDTDQQIPTTTGAGTSTVLPSGTALATALGGMSPNTAMYNMPYSKRVNQAKLDLDWTVARGNKLLASYDEQKTTRWCGQIPTAALSADTLYIGANGATGKYLVNNVAVAKIDNCFNSLSATEHTARLEYVNRMLPDLTGRISWQDSQRKSATYNADVAQYAQDFLTRFDMTDRDRNRARASVSWRVTDAIDLGLNLSTAKDDYTLGRNPTGNLALGLASAKSDSASLDAGFRVNDQLSFTAYYTQENQSQKLNGNASANNGTPAALTAATSTTAPADWQADLRDRSRSFGLGFNANELMGGKLAISGDYSQTRNSSPYLTSATSGFGFSTSTTDPTKALTTAAFAAGLGMPVAFTNTDTLKFSLKYALDKNQAIRVSYIYQKLTSADAAMYNGLQVGAAAGTPVNGSATAKVNGTAVPITSVYAISALLPTNEQAPNYKAQAIGLAWVYTFR
jgi:MtrB/PioB family decaheme-associated outer membrane protein